MLVLGHRGVMGEGFTENTLAAFQAAVDLGVDGIETDVRLSRDGRLVLFHDRLDAAGTPVAELDHAELEAAEGHHVPELHEVLARWPDLLWDLEIKSPHFIEPLRRALDGIEAPRLILSSPYHDFLHAHGRDLGLPFGLVLNHRPVSAEALLRAWAGRMPEYCIWNLDYVDGGILKAVGESGVANLVYNVHTPADVRTVRDWGCAGVILDQPEVALAVLGRDAR
ncbi:MAG: glycerophosphodiester phosphodiesterase [Thiohalorhabdus sp.]|uniref:glycerophosphodiester phosphodiesterase n=1 Tax=Thiohalorhabdus sp. TaxID=3094134 RepID=UPI00397F13A1